jgi:hypothetical protein
MIPLFDSVTRRRPRCRDRLAGVAPHFQHLVSHAAHPSVAVMAGIVKLDVRERSASVEKSNFPRRQQGPLPGGRARRRSAMKRDYRRYRR